MKIDLQFADFLQGAGDQEIMSDAPGDTEEFSDVPCILDKIIAEASLGSFLGHGASGQQRAHNLGVEASERETAITNHYKKIASAAEKQSAGETRLEKRATGEVFTVGQMQLGKSEIVSRMLTVLCKILPFCIAGEAKEIEKSIRCLDFSLFGELTEPVLSRMKDALEGIR